MTGLDAIDSGARWANVVRLEIGAEPSMNREEVSALTGHRDAVRSP